MSATESFFSFVYFTREYYSWHAVRQATYSGAHFITDAKIKAALLVHGVIYPREFRQLRPLVLKGIIQQTVIGAGEKKKKKKVNQSQLHLMICTHTPLKLNPFADERERQGLRKQRTECIDWAPVCCSVTSDSDGKLLELAEPWCCPCWSHQRSGCPGRHAPCLACGGRKKLYWRGGAQNQRTFRPEKYSQPTVLVPIQLEKDWK